jgi:prephenate dehydrogenase
LGVIGLGAIGGSVAWGATRAGVEHVVGYARAEDDATAAKEAGAVGAIASSPESLIDQSDLVVLAAPPKANLKLLERVHDAVAKRAVVLTDVTSVQLPLLERAEELGLGSSVVASHPFCGTHESGFAAAKSDMLSGAVVYVSHASAEDEVTQGVMSFWQRLGTSPMVVDAAWHDQLVAWTSHLPQAVSTVLAVTLASDAPIDGTFGSGALDTTRLAASSVEMWRDLMMLNRQQLLEALESYDRHSALLRTALEEGDAEAIAAWLEKGAAFRRNL